MSPMPNTYYAHPTACIDTPTKIGENTRIWHFCHIMKDAHIGRDCVLGQNVFVASGVRIGNRVRIQNNVSLYAGISIDDDVFIGPSFVFTNIKNPRAELDRRAQFQSTHIGRGATLGANATLLPGLRIGRHAFIAAGAVITHPVADYTLMMGVPARESGYIGRHGHLLSAPNAEGFWVCPESGYRYIQDKDQLRCLDLPEDQSLPEARLPEHFFELP